MRLSKIAILAIRGHKDLKDQLAEVLGVDKATIFRWLSSNSDNLTKAAAIDLIKKETGLSAEQILEKEKAEEVQK